MQKLKHLLKHRNVLILGLVILFAALSLLFLLRPSDGLPAPDEIVTHSTDSPSEKPVPVEPDKYTVAADMPRVISLPSINAEGYIQRVGIDQHDLIAVPTNVNMAGWYVNSLKPGEQGLSIISAHVDGRTGPGLFKHLGDLKRNDHILVEYGDGTKRTFAVKELTHVVEGDAANLLFAKHGDIDSQLNLITCSGNFDPSSRTYNQRIVVVTELVSD